MLKSTKQSFDDKKCATASISWTKFYEKYVKKMLKVILVLIENH